MMETTLIMMDAQAFAKLNVVMDSSLDLRSVIWDLSMPTLLTNANSTARLPNVVMDMLILLRNVIMLLLDLPLLPAEATANSHTVVTQSSMQSTEKIVITDFLETMISQALDAQLDAHKTLVDMFQLEMLVISTELWPAQDVSMLTSDLLLDPPAVVLSNGWLLNLFKRFLNIKLMLSLTFGEPQSEEAKREIVNSVTHTLSECAIVSQQVEWLLLLVMLAHLFPESQLSKPLLISFPEIPLELLFSNQQLLLLFPSLFVNHSFCPHTSELEPTLPQSLPVKLKLSILED
jgi:hypothetical protein